MCEEGSKEQEEVQNCEVQPVCSARACQSTGSARIIDYLSSGLRSSGCKFPSLRVCMKYGSLSTKGCPCSPV
jgi:hypothetical protein